MKDYFLSFFLIAAGMVYADNAPVGDRPMSAETQTAFLTERENEQQSEELSECETKEKDGYDPDYCPVSPSFAHIIVSLSQFGDALEIEDGSIWRINCSDVRHMRSWYYNDPIIITQNHKWFSDSKYRIINKNDGTSVAADLYLGPQIGGNCSLQITNIDHYNELLILSDNTHWKISSRDHNLFPEWTIGDYVILGINSGWDSSCPYILINSNMNNFIRARQY